MTRRTQQIAARLAAADPGDLVEWDTSAFSDSIGVQMRHVFANAPADLRWLLERLERAEALIKATRVAAEPAFQTGMYEWLWCDIAAFLAEDE